jgi:cation diffusion facilitator CzcD-associated flavoprotein CzcO
VEKQRFKDADHYRDFRLMIERELASVHYITHRDSPGQAFVRGVAEEKMREMLQSKPAIAAALIPNFTVGCKRLTPGPGFLDALTQDNVDFVTTDLECFTPEGIRTVDGQEYTLDAIICATGYNTSAVPRFPIYGLDGVNLQDVWGAEARTYLSIGVPKMPNL